MALQSNSSALTFGFQAGSKPSKNRHLLAATPCRLPCRVMWPSAGSSAHLVGAVHLKLDGHLRGGGVLPRGRVHKVLVLVVRVVGRHHGVQDDAGVADAQRLGPLPLELHISPQVRLTRLEQWPVPHAAVRTPPCSGWSNRGPASSAALLPCRAVLGRSWHLLPAKPDQAQAWANVGEGLHLAADRAVRLPDDMAGLPGCCGSIKAPSATAACMGWPGQSSV